MNENTSKLEFHEAISKIEERGDFNRYAEVKPIFTQKLNELSPEEYTETGLCYYYLLVSYLKAHLVHETEESVEFYEKMDNAFVKQEEIFIKNAKNFSLGEIHDFYRLMDRCYGALYFLYAKHDFKFRQSDAHERRMKYRKNYYWFKRDFWKWFEYKFLETTCSYGNNLMKWAVTTGVFIVFMSFVYFVVDQATDPHLRIVSVQNGHWYDYFYFSGITMATVGYGDIVPITFVAKFLVNMQAFIGFLMLGIFIGLIQKRL